MSFERRNRGLLQKIKIFPIVPKQSCVWPTHTFLTVGLAVVNKYNSFNQTLATQPILNSHVGRCYKH